MVGQQQNQARVEQCALRLGKIAVRIDQLLTTRVRLTLADGDRTSNNTENPVGGGRLVPRDRVELSTHGFSVRCSTS